MYSTFGMCLLATALLAAKPWLKRNLVGRLQRQPEGRQANLAGVGATAFAGAVYGGYFGAGLGIVMLASSLGG